MCGEVTYDPYLLVLCDTWFDRPGVVVGTFVRYERKSILSLSPKPNEAEREKLKSLIAAGIAPARKLTHVRILLKADQSPEGPGWVDQQVAEALETSQPTVSRVRSSTLRKAWRRCSIKQ